MSCSRFFLEVWQNSRKQFEKIRNNNNNNKRYVGDSSVQAFPKVH